MFFWGSKLALTASLLSSPSPPPPHKQKGRIVDFSLLPGDSWDKLADVLWLSEESKKSFK